MLTPFIFIFKGIRKLIFFMPVADKKLALFKISLISSGN